MFSFITKEEEIGLIVGIRLPPNYHSREDYDHPSILELISHAVMLCEKLKQKLTSPVRIPDIHGKYQLKEDSACFQWGFEATQEKRDVINFSIND
ncbi:hypothetical protein GYA49_00490 [Candidatus Beckwithbacteria bacterium]|nr:hypothetical protein [Candidatus Beckwithbacteria bacterium]